MARRKRHAFRRVSLLVKPVRRPTARGGKKMLKRVIVRRLARGMCISVWGMYSWPCVVGILATRPDDFDRRTEIAVRDRVTIERYCS